MDIKKTSNLIINFILKRLTEVLGIVLSLAGVLLFASLLTYSPEDPNFIFPNNTNFRTTIL